MDRILSKIPTIAEVSKHPFAWLILIFGLLVGALMQEWKESSRQVNINCEKENQRLRDENVEKDKRLINLYNQILSERRMTDSIARERVGKQSAEIIKSTQ